MRLGWIMAVVAFILGSGVGVWRAQREFRVGGERFQPYNPVSTNAEGTPLVENIVVVNGNKYEFGMLQRGSKMSHDFILQNVSDHPIKLWVGGSSCTCTVASLGGDKAKSSDSGEPDGKTDGKSDDELPTDLGGDTKDKIRLLPGESTPITMQWEGLTSNPQFNQNAEIRTDDPEQPSIDLFVTGYVQDLVTIRPDAIQMNNVSVEDGATAAAIIYCAKEEFPKVISTKFVVEETADKFEVELLEVDEIEDPAYKSARRLVVRAKPGMPVGTISQKLRLDLDMGGENAIFVAITAKVESELTILAGKDYYSPTGTVRWGVVDKEKGRETTLFVIVKGDHKESVKLAPAFIDPAESLEVEVLPVKNRDAATWTIPVKVRLKSDSPPVLRLGGAESEAGVIRLSTGHPVAQELQFKVQFAVN